METDPKEIKWKKISHTAVYGGVYEFRPLYWPVGVKPSRISVPMMLFRIKPIEDFGIIFIDLEPNE